MAATYADRFAIPSVRLGPMALPMEEVRPKNEHRRRWLPHGKLYRPDRGSTATAVDQLYHDSRLVDKNTNRHLTMPTVRQHLHHRGFVAKNTTAYPKRQEQVESNRTYRFQHEREALLLKVETREQARLQRLRRAARAGDITFTRDGIVETKPCYTCQVKHKVASISNPIEPCPRSRLAKYNVSQHLAPLPEPYRTRRSHKRRDYSAVPHTTMATQTFNMLACSPSPSSVASVEHVSTQTSSVFRELPSQSQTRESTSTVMSSCSVGRRNQSHLKKNVSVHTSTSSNGCGLHSQSNVIKRDSLKGLNSKSSRSSSKGRVSLKASSASQSRVRGKTSTKISAMVDPYVASPEVTACSDKSLELCLVQSQGPTSSKFSRYPISSAAPVVTTQPGVTGAASAYSEASSSGMGSSPSTQDCAEDLQLELRRVDDELNRNILEQEEEALQNRLELEMKLLEKAMKRKKEEEVAVAMRKLHEKKEENRLTLELKDMIKLNTALLTILNTSKMESHRNDYTKSGTAEILQSPRASPVMSSPRLLSPLTNEHNYTLLKRPTPPSSPPSENALRSTSVRHLRGKTLKEADIDKLFQVPDQTDHTPQLQGVSSTHQNEVSKTAPSPAGSPVSPQEGLGPKRLSRSTSVSMHLKKILQVEKSEATNIEGSTSIQVKTGSVGSTSSVSKGSIPSHSVVLAPTLEVPTQQRCYDSRSATQSTDSAAIANTQGTLEMPGRLSATLLGASSDEDEMGEFTEELNEPLTLSNMALVQYESLNTRLGLRRLAELNALGGPRPSLSTESLVGEEVITDNCEMPQFILETSDSVADHLQESISEEGEKNSIGSRSVASITGALSSIKAHAIEVEGATSGTSGTIDRGLSMSSPVVQEDSSVILPLDLDSDAQQEHDGRFTIETEEYFQKNPEEMQVSTSNLGAFSKDLSAAESVPETSTPKQGNNELRYPSGARLGVLSQRHSTSQWSRTSNSTLDCSSMAPLASSQSAEGRPPTPPIYTTPLYNSSDTLASSFRSLKTIKEDELTDFTEKLSEPVTHSNVALVQYESRNTRLGLHQLAEVSAVCSPRPCLSTEFPMAMGEESVTENCEMPESVLETTNGPPQKDCKFEKKSAGTRSAASVSSSIDTHISIGDNATLRTVGSTDRRQSISAPIVRKDPPVVPLKSHEVSTLDSDFVVEASCSLTSLDSSIMDEEEDSDRSEIENAILQNCLSRLPITAPPSREDDTGYILSPNVSTYKERSLQNISPPQSVPSPVKVRTAFSVGYFANQNEQLRYSEPPAVRYPSGLEPSCSDISMSSFCSSLSLWDDDAPPDEAAIEQEDNKPKREEGATSSERQSPEDTKSPSITSLASPSDHTVATNTSHAVQGRYSRTGMEEDTTVQVMAMADSDNEPSDGDESSSTLNSVPLNGNPARSLEAKTTIRGPSQILESQELPATLPVDSSLCSLNHNSLTESNEAEHVSTVDMALEKEPLHHGGLSTTQVACESSPGSPSVPGLSGSNEQGITLPSTVSTLPTREESSTIGVKGPLSSLQSLLPTSLNTTLRSHAEVTVASTLLPAKLSADKVTFSSSLKSPRSSSTSLRSLTPTSGNVKADNLKTKSKPRSSVETEKVQRSSSSLGNSLSERPSYASVSKGAARSCPSLRAAKSSSRVSVRAFPRNKSSASVKGHPLALLHERRQTSQAAITVEKGLSSHSMLPDRYESCVTLTEKKASTKPLDIEPTKSKKELEEEARQTSAETTLSTSKSRSSSSMKKMSFQPTSKVGSLLSLQNTDLAPASHTSTKGMEASSTSLSPSNGSIISLKEIRLPSSLKLEKNASQTSCKEPFSTSMKAANRSSHVSLRSRSWHSASSPKERELAHSSVTPEKKTFHTFAKETRKQSSAVSLEKTQSSVSAKSVTSKISLRSTKDEVPSTLKERKTSHSSLTELKKKVQPTGSEETFLNKDGSQSSLKERKPHTPMKKVEREPSRSSLKSDVVSFRASLRSESGSSSSSQKKQKLPGGSVTLAKEVSSTSMKETDGQSSVAGVSLVKESSRTSTKGKVSSTTSLGSRKHRSSSSLKETKGSRTSLAELMKEAAQTFSHTMEAPSGKGGSRSAMKEKSSKLFTEFGNEELHTSMEKAETHTPVKLENGSSRTSLGSKNGGSSSSLKKQLRDAKEASHTSTRDTVEQPSVVSVSLKDDPTCASSKGNMSSRASLRSAKDGSSSSSKITTSRSSVAGLNCEALRSSTEKDASSNTESKSPDSFIVPVRAESKGCLSSLQSPTKGSLYSLKDGCTSRRSSKASLKSKVSSLMSDILPSKVKPSAQLECTMKSPSTSSSSLGKDGSNTAVKEEVHLSVKQSSSSSLTGTKLDLCEVRVHRKGSMEGKSKIGASSSSVKCVQHKRGSSVSLRSMNCAPKEMECLTETLRKSSGTLKGSTSKSSVNSRRSAGQDQHTSATVGEVGKSASKSSIRSTVSRADLTLSGKRSMSVVSTASKEEQSHSAASLQSGRRGKKGSLASLLASEKVKN